MGWGGGDGARVGGGRERGCTCYCAGADDFEAVGAEEGHFDS